MVDARLLKGKTKVLTSIRSKETRTVDPEIQKSADEYREVRRCCDQQKEPIWAGRDVEGWGGKAVCYILNFVK